MVWSSANNASEKLADLSDRYRTETDVRPLLEEKLRPLNERRTAPESTLAVTDYVAQRYLPYAQENCKPSTYSAYETQWELYLAARLKTTALRDFRTAERSQAIG